MANRQRQQVRYNQFRPGSVKAEGLLAVARENGDLERRVAAGLARLAGEFGQFADRHAAMEGERAGIRDALAGSPKPGMVTAGSAPQGIVVGSRDANATAAAARDYLMEKHGLAAHHAAAIAGHGMQESNFNLKAVGDNGTAFGAFQWRGDRLTNLKRFAARSGRNWQTLDVQLDFAVHELNTSESYAGNALRKATNLQEAVAAFMHFERPAGYSRANPTAGHGFANRLAFAQGLSGVAVNENARSGPVRVTPIVDPAEGSAGEPVPMGAAVPGSFRPTGSATIRGRAYDVAGTRTYLQQLDVTMQQDMGRIYEAYSQDPALLEKALGELKQAHMSDHVFEEIAGDYSSEFERKSFRMLERSREAAKIRQEQQERTEFLSRIDGLEEEKARFLAGQNAGAERDAEDLFSIQASIDTHYDDAVRRGLMTPAQAQTAKRSSMQDTATAFYLGQADGKTADEISALRADMARDYAAGTLANVDRESYARIDAGLTKAERSRSTAEQQGLQDLRRKGDDMARRIVAGETIPPAEVTAYHRLMQSTPGADGVARSALLRLQIAQILKTAPLPLARKQINDLLTPKDGESADAGDMAFARDLVAGHEKALAKDPLGVAERHGAIAPVASILDGMQQQGVVATILERMDVADAAADHFGVAPRFFTPGETAEVASLIKSDPQAGLDLVSGVIEAAEDRAGDILKELRASAPEAEWAGVVLALGGSQQAAQDALLGNQPGPDGKARPNPVSRKQAHISGSVIGPALSQLHPDDRARVEASALSIARKRALEAGVKPDGAEAQEIYTRALNEAAGAVYGPDGQRGGFGMVNGRQTLLPPGLSADDVEDALEELTEDDLEAMGRPLSPMEDLGVTISADDIRGGILLAVAPGIYRVARERGGRLHYIGDPAGGFWELNMNRLIGVQRSRSGLPFYRTEGSF